MSINVVERIDDRVKVRHILVSVSDKQGLDAFIPALVQLNPELRIFSTGGTFAHLEKILGPSAGRHLTQVSDYTGQPETQGGLVKTLDFKIYLGLLTETYNNAHQADLQRTGGVAIDLVVVNLYPFRETIAKAGVSLEQARIMQGRRQELHPGGAGGRPGGLRRDRIRAQGACRVHHARPALPPGRQGL